MQHISLGCSMYKKEVERKFLVFQHLLPNLTEYNYVIIDQFYIPIEMFSLQTTNNQTLVLLFKDKIITEILVNDSVLKSSFSELIEARLRITTDEAVLTLKSDHTSGERDEFEWVIDDIKVITNLLIHTSKHLKKKRYKIPYNGVILELDKFDKFPYYLVEVENCPEFFACPMWFSSEVTDYKKYYNRNIAE
jgi:CYTH domain-containing protein